MKVYLIESERMMVIATGEVQLSAESSENMRTKLLSKNNNIKNVLIVPGEFHYIQDDRKKRKSWLNH